MSKIYRNRTVINQRGAAISINNTTDQESIHLSQRSGSNILLNNIVNSEFATNNKQTLIVNDEFKTVGKDSTDYITKNKNTRVGGSVYEYKGFIDESQIDAHKQWKNTFKSIANLNAKFKIKRGGITFPNGEMSQPEGDRDKNPVIGSKIFVVENEFSGYSGTPVRTFQSDEVASYSKVPDYGKTKPASEKEIEKIDIEKSAGEDGSKAPGVLEFGAEKSAATENGKWSPDEDAQKINEKILELQDTLTPIEQNMGEGGDENLFTKRNKFETIGAIFNDYPSIRIDEKGRSQPFEVLVSDKGIYKNHDYIPHIEEVDNSSNFPCGQDIKVVGNSYSRIVGSGGISLKTTGAMELGGSTFKGGFKKINLNASHGVHIGSENGIELQSIKTIVLRTNRQVYVESSMGIRNNLIVGGGLAVEGETYLQHVTAPLEVQQTEDTIVAGKFATENDRQLIIGECVIAGNWFPVYAKATHNLISNYPHSHHFNNIPLRLTKSNSDVRKIAQNNNINSHDTISQSYPQVHEKKNAISLE